MSDRALGKNWYHRAVATRLRSIHRQRHLSPIDAAQLPALQLRAFVADADEHGEREASVAGSQRLALFRVLPTDQLLLDGDDSRTTDRSCQAARWPRLSIDVTRLERAGEDRLASFLNRIQSQRRDLDCRVMTVRRADSNVLADLAGVPVDELARELDRRGLSVSP